MDLFIKHLTVDVPSIVLCAFLFHVMKINVYYLAGYRRVTQHGKRIFFKKVRGLKMTKRHSANIIHGKYAPKHEKMIPTGRLDVCCYDPACMTQGNCHQSHGHDETRLLPGSASSWMCRVLSARQSPSFFF